MATRAASISGFRRTASGRGIPLRAGGPCRPARDQPRRPRCRPRSRRSLAQIWQKFRTVCVSGSLIRPARDRSFENRRVPTASRLPGMYPGSMPVDRCDQAASILEPSGRKIDVRRVRTEREPACPPLSQGRASRGDHIAIFMENNLRYCEVMSAAGANGALLHMRQLVPDICGGCFHR